jgi:hypothetical protein
VGNARLAIYLNDHLACAAAAIALLERLAATDGEPAFRVRMRELRSEIAEDRRVLGTLLSRVGGTPSVPKQDAGWLAEKLARLKIGAGPGDTLARFESLEALAVGVIGKRGLWRALGALAAPELSSTDFDALAERATRQYEQLEHERLRLAPAALGGTAGARAGGAMR